MNIPEGATHEYSRNFYQLKADGSWYVWGYDGWRKSRIGAAVLDSKACELPVPYKVSITVPEGFKLVPVEPTPEMLNVEVSPVLCVGLPDNPRVAQWRAGVYQAMLAAAPVPPQADAQPVAWLMMALRPNGEVYRKATSSTELTLRDARYCWGQAVLDRFTIVIKPLYTHADAGEVERLRAVVNRCRNRVSKVIIDKLKLRLERDALRAKLAERDALLRETVDFLVFGKLANNLPDRIVATLSASAEPVSSFKFELACDRAYRNGMQAGFTFGINGDETGYQKSFDAYQRGIVEASADTVTTCCGSCPGGCVIQARSDHAG
jgi:hypothetical protein